MEKIRKSDQFWVHAKAFPDTNSLQALALLYQPLIGDKAYTLYMTLCALVNRQTLISEKYLHSDLESIMSVKLEQLEEARLKLEAVGLLGAYLRDDCFLYELKPPLSAYSFTNDGILGQHLRNALTDSRFDRILDLFKVPLVKTDEYRKITKQFDDVFTAASGPGVPYHADLIDGAKAEGAKVRKSDFDFRLFRESIPDPFFDPDKFTDLVRDKIKNVTYVYGLDELTMKDIYIKALDSTLNCNLNRLAALSRESYQEQIRRDGLKAAAEEVTKQDAFSLPTEPIPFFESVTPKELLRMMSGGRAAISDLRIVEDLLESTGLDKGVMNVLLAYVLKNKDMQLPGYEYLEKVALGWKRNQIDSVKTAVVYVDHLVAEYGKIKDKPTYTGKKGKPERPDVEISWLDDYVKSL